MNAECRDVTLGFAPINCVESSISAFSIPNSAFTSRFLQQYHIHREVVAIAAHPDATGESAERITVVAASVLFQEPLVVDFHVLELVGAVVGGQQARGDDGLVEDGRHITVVVGAITLLVQFIHGVEELAVAQVVHLARGAQVFRHALVVGVVVEVAHHDDLGVLVLTHDGVSDVAAQFSGSNTAGH